jgi:hypothetical protein
MKNLVKVLSIATLLSTTAFADGNGPSNLVLNKSISSDSSRHYVSKSFSANSAAQKEISAIFTDFYNNRSQNSVMINEKFEYLTDGTTAPLVGVKSCSIPNQDHDYIAHNSQVQLELQASIASICKNYGYSSVNIDFGAFPGSQMSFNDTDNNDGILDELYYVRTITGKRNLVMICSYTQGLCSGESNL